MSDDDTTQSTKTRWEYTNDVAALLLVLSFVVAVAAGVYAVVTGRIDASVDVGLLVYGYVALVLLAFAGVVEAVVRLVRGR